MAVFGSFIIELDLENNDQFLKDFKSNKEVEGYSVMILGRKL
jgi:hypothetical protein